MFSPPWKLSEPCLFGFSWRLQLHRHDWLPLATGEWFNPTPSFLPWGQEGGTESSNPPITLMVPLAISPHPSVLSKSRLIYINSHVVERGLLGILILLLLFSLRKFQVFLGALCQKLGTETKYVFLLYITMNFIKALVPMHYQDQLLGNELLNPVFLQPSLVPGTRRCSMNGCHQWMKNEF